MKMLNFSFKKLIYSPTGFLFIAFVLNTQFSSAQFSFSTKKEKVETRNGNKDFQNEKFTDAEASYKKALDIKNNMEEAIFNLGDAIYEQKRYEDAGKQFQLSAQTNSDETVKAKAYHNLGNSFMQEKKYEEAIKAYKSSLKINPQDADTKYNLAYANEMIRTKNGEGGQDNKDKKNKQDSKDEKQQNKDNKDEKKEEKQDQQQQKDQEQKDKKQGAEQPKMSKEEADQLLKALQNEEQKTAQKMQQKKTKGVRVKSKKDW